MTEEVQGDSQHVETHIRGNGGTRIDSKPDPLDDYEFGLQDAFVRWHPWGDERADDDIWGVTNVSWRFKTSWIVDRDDFPTRANHRVYQLVSRETSERVEVSEAELLSGDWKHVETVEEGDDD